MRDPTKPPREPGSNVISIVEELQRRRLSREREQARAMHLRELENALSVIESTKTLEETDFDAELAKIDPLPPDAARLARAELRGSRALQRCLRGDAEAGFAEWAEVIAEVPELAYTYLLRARWRMRTAPAEALGDYDRAAAVEPTNPIVYWRRAACHQALGDQDRALANYRRAIALDPKAIDVLRDMAKLLADRGEHAEAVAAYDRAIAEAPRYVDFYLGRARALEELGDFTAALRDYGRILELDPTRNDVRFYRVMCHAEAGDGDRAIEAMRALLALEPDDHTNHRMLGKLRLENHQVALALEDLSRAIEMAPEVPAAYVHRARAFFTAGDKGRALADLDRAIELAPEEPEYAIERSLIRLPDLPPKEALAELGRILEIRPDSPPLVGLYAKLLDKDGDHERAVKTFVHAVSLTPGDAELYVGRARAYAALGQVEDALADAERILERAPEHAFGHSMRAAYRKYLGGDAALVDADFDRAVALAPDDASVRHHRADHLMDEGKYAAAFADYDRAIAVAPRIASAYCGRGACRSRLDEEQMNLDDDYEEEDGAREARYRAAVVDFERAIELGLRTDEVYTELWNAHCMLEENEVGLTALDRGIEAVPTSAILFYHRHYMRKNRGDEAGAAADRARAVELGFQFRE